VWELLHNLFLPKTSDANEGINVESRKQKSDRIESLKGYELIVAPLHSHYFEHGTGWISDTKSAYQRYACRTKGCNQRARNCCACSPGHWRCVECYASYRVNVATGLEG